MTQRTLFGLTFDVSSPSVYQLRGFPVQIFFCNGACGCWHD